MVVFAWEAGKGLSFVHEVQSWQRWGKEMAGHWG